MNRKTDKKLAAALSAKVASEKALLFAEAAAKHAHTAKIEFKLAKKTWKLARKAAKRTAKEAHRRQKELAKFGALLKQTKQRATKPARRKAGRMTRKPAKPSLAPVPAAPRTVVAATEPPDAAN